MRKNRFLALLGGTTAVVGAIALAPNAQAACVWNGYGWICNQPVPAPFPGGPAPFSGGMLPSVPPGSDWGNQRYTPEGYNYNNYDQIANDYPGPALTGGSGGSGGGDRN